ncbi:MAG: hypothetical protein AABN34_04510 [Acidobacteriota bacterium]
MSKLRLALNILAVAVFSLAISSVAQAQATRTWVSGVGDDANPCSRTAPCKTFAGAISKTAGGGEIDALDPGGFGAVTITKAMTIDGGTGSGWASILAAGSNGVIINATANDVITLRNLSINGVRQTTTPGINGVRFLAGKSLHIQNCNIFGFNSNGVDISSTADGKEVTIQDSTIRECGASGVSVVTTVGIVKVDVTNTRIDRCVQGFSAAGGTRASFSNSVLSLCTSNGINTASNSETNVTDSFLTNNATAINVASGATVRLNSNVFAQNTVASVTNAGVVTSASNNKMMGSPNATGNAFGAFTIQ